MLVENKWFCLTFTILVWREIELKPWGMLGEVVDNDDVNCKEVTVRKNLGLVFPKYEINCKDVMKNT